MKTNKKKVIRNIAVFSFLLMASATYLSFRPPYTEETINEMVKHEAPVGSSRSEVVAFLSRLHDKDTKVMSSTEPDGKGKIIIYFPTQVVISGFDRFFRYSEVSFYFDNTGKMSGYDIM